VLFVALGVGILLGALLGLAMFRVALTSLSLATPPSRFLRLILAPFWKTREALLNTKGLVLELKGRLGVLLAVLDSIEEGVILLTGELRVVHANQSAVRLLGLKGDAVNKHLKYEIRDFRLIEAIEALILDANHGRRREVRTGGELLAQGCYLGLRASCLEEDLWVVLVQDLTEWKRLEAVRSDFIANVAHELKTPITTINGFLETLLDSALEDQSASKRFLGIAKRHTDRMDRLINELFLLSNLELGNVNMAVGNHNLLELIQETLEILLPMVQEKGLRLEVRCASKIWVACDRDKILQVLINVVENAIKYTNEGGVTVGAECQQGQGKVWVSVEDTGIGIPRSDLSRITERFYRVDKARSRALGGTGLGLAIVKHLLQLHNGELIIESDVGKGTRVAFCLSQADSRAGGEGHAL
jgi:two-component system phosphate regulon sensor histidine kinase PhoR